MSAVLLGRQVFFRVSFTLRHVPAHLLHDLSGEAGVYTGKACTNLRHTAVSVSASLFTPNVLVAGHYGFHWLRKSAGGHGLQMGDREVRLYPCNPAKAKRESCVLVLCFGDRGIWRSCPILPRGWLSCSVWEESVATGRCCCQCVSCPGLLQVLQVVSGKGPGS